MNDQHNPWEADLDVDEDTGEVILPPGYTGRRRGGLANPNLNINQSSGTISPTLIRRDDATPPAAPASRDAPKAPGAAQTPPTVTVDPNGRVTADCPPCPACPPAPGRMRAPRDSWLGLVIGLGMVGGVLYYIGREAAMNGVDAEELEQIMASLPDAPPKMLASGGDDDVLEGEVVSGAEVA